MNKKELRKELELILVKAIEEALNKRKPNVAAQIRKTTFEASKAVAKKFYKTIRTTAPKKAIPTKAPVQPAAAPKKGSSIKPAPKTAPAVKRTVKRTVKKKK